MSNLASFFNVYSSFVDSEKIYLFARAAGDEELHYTCYDGSFNFLRNCGAACVSETLLFGVKGIEKDHITTVT